MTSRAGDFDGGDLHRLAGVAAQKVTAVVAGEHGRSAATKRVGLNAASLLERIALLEKALKPLADIADLYDADGLDECRPYWNKPNDADVELYSGRGGKELLYLRDALAARNALRGRPVVPRKNQPSPYSSPPSKGKAE